MNGPHKTLRKVVGRALGELLYLAVERQQNQDAEVGSKKPTNNKDVTWTIQSASAYLAFLFNKSIDRVLMAYFSASLKHFYLK